MCFQLSNFGETYATQSKTKNLKFQVLKYVKLAFNFREIISDEDSLENDKIPVISIKTFEQHGISSVFFGIVHGKNEVDGGMTSLS